MTREEAIYWIENLSGNWDGKYREARDMAISALRQQETVTKCHDLYDEDGGEIYQEKDSICSSTNLPCCRCNPGPCEHRKEPVTNRNGLIVDDLVPAMMLDDAIDHLDDTLSDTYRKWSCESCRLEHVQLRAWLAELRDIKQKRNDPLTLDELRKMDGEPVWVCFIDGVFMRDDGWFILALLNESQSILEGKHPVYKNLEVYGKTWLAYRQKPEDGTR